jgi:hypothetical protein
VRAAPPTPIDLSQFKVGEATVTDVERKLGAPMSQYSMSNGMVTLAYSDVHCG